MPSTAGASPKVVDRRLSLLILIPPRDADGRASRPAGMVLDVIAGCNLKYLALWAGAIIHGRRTHASATLLPALSLARLRQLPTEKDRGCGDEGDEADASKRFGHEPDPLGNAKSGILVSSSSTTCHAAQRLTNSSSCARPRNA
jgi:hypothetical protein